MKARLDADKTAKPLTQITAHHPTGECVLPGINALSYFYSGLEMEDDFYDDSYDREENDYYGSAMSFRAYEKRMEERTLEQILADEEYRDLERLWDDFDSGNLIPLPLETRVRDGHLAKAISDLGAEKWVRNRKAGSYFSYIKRQLRRAERRVGKEMILEQILG